MKPKTKKQATAKQLISQAKKAGIKIVMTTEGVVEIDPSVETPGELLKTLTARAEDLEFEIVHNGLSRLVALTIERLES